VHMNFYAASVALLWTTAMQLSAPDAGAPGSVRSAAARCGVDPVSKNRAARASTGHNNDGLNPSKECG